MLFFYVCENFIAIGLAFGKGVYKTAPETEPYLEKWLEAGKIRAASAQEIADYAAANAEKLAAANGGFIPKETLFQTGIIAAGAEAEGAPELGKLFILTKVEVNNACRLRVYRSEAFRAADQNRPRNVKPEPENGLICELIFENVLVLALSPLAHGATAETPPSSASPLIVENLSGAETEIEVRFTTIILEK